MRVPTRFQDATPEFVTEALRSTGTIADDTEVAEIEADQIGEGVGLMCTLARLTLRYRGPAHGAPSSVILKVPSELPENRQVGDHFNFYEREGRFYEHIGQAVAVRTPKCLFNHIDTDGQQFALLLEDFGGRTMVSQIAGIEFERAAEAVKAIATVHAQWWDTPAVHALDWMPRATDPEIVSAGASYRQAWPRFVELFGDHLPDGAVELGEQVGPTWEATQTHLHESAPTTLCHGDYRADNLMFDDSTSGHGHVGVLDWQISYRSAAISDICYLITQSMTADDRREHDREIVEIWYAALTAALGGAPIGYTLDDAWDGYRASTANMTVYAVVGGGQLDPSNERGLELVRDMAARSFSAALELDAAALIPS
jgi:aminoglycoside phosphotransferase (APT) family kinase protein